MRITIVSTLAAGYIAFGGIADAGGFTMVKDGVGKCVLVTSGKLSPSEETAVKEFKHLVAEMSGAQLASQGIQEAEGQPKIVIGKEAVTKLYPKVELSGLGEEGFIIKQQGQDLLVAGGALRGTMYGLYTLLENLGCRWLAEDENSIPKKKTLEVSLTDSRQVPVLEQRNIMYAGTSGAWSAHNKINRPGWDTIEDKYGGTFATAGPQAHDLFLLMEEAGVKVADDMQCVWEGKRENAQLCVTDPRVIDAFTKALIKIAKSKPSVPYVQLMMEDNKKYCQCDRCKAIDAKAESHAGQTVYCVNQIAKVLAKEVPGTDLMFGAYLATRTPPKNTVLESNVVVQLALIESNYMRPLADGHVEANRKGLEDIVAWGKLAEKIFIWDYVVNFDHYNIMFPNLDVLTPNVKFYVDHRARHIMEQAAHTGKNAEFFQLRRWVLAKALWNPEADNQELISDFLTHYYGPAATAIQEYIDVIHKPARTTVFEFTSRLNAPYLKPEIIAAAEVAMQKADKLAKGDPSPGEVEIGGLGNRAVRLPRFVRKLGLDGGQKVGDLAGALFRLDAGDVAAGHCRVQVVGFVSNVALDYAVEAIFFPQIDIRACRETDLCSAAIVFRDFIHGVHDIGIRDRFFAADFAQGFHPRISHAQIGHPFLGGRCFPAMTPFHIGQPPDAARTQLPKTQAFVRQQSRQGAHRPAPQGARCG